MKIEHCPGKENQLADLFYRNPVEEVTEELDDQERLLPPINDEAVPLSEVEPDSAIFTMDSLTLVEELRDAQQNDPYHSKMTKRYIDLTQRSNLTENNALSTTTASSTESYGNATSQTDHTKSWFHKQQWPGSYTSTMRYTRHPGAEETFRAILEFHRWPKMRNEIRDYVRHCFLCVCCKNSKTSTTTTLRPHQPKKPWDTISWVHSRGDRYV